MGEGEKAEEEEACEGKGREGGAGEGRSRRRVAGRWRRRRASDAGDAVGADCVIPPRGDDPAPIHCGRAEPAQLAGVEHAVGG